jgi:hypothetical protein
MLLTPVSKHPNLMTEAEWSEAKDAGQYDYTGKCPGCDLPYAEGKFDTWPEECEATEPWALGWCEGCCHN